jgi:hypothetical protein
MRGFRLRIAQTALLEWNAACVRQWEGENGSRQEARKKFFGRAKSIASFLDHESPIAMDGGALTARIVAEVDGEQPHQGVERTEHNLTSLWREIVGVEMTDEEFRDAGRKADEFLASLDEGLIRLARREEELRQNAPPPGMDSAQLAADYATYDTLAESAKLDGLRRHCVTTWEFSPAVAERFDGHICTTAYRLHMAARGARLPKKNDGADASLTLHLGAGCILLTDERKLVDIVDESGTFQAPWVRQSHDLDDLPQIPAWGEQARNVVRAFRRKR